MPISPQVTVRRYGSRSSIRLPVVSSSSLSTVLVEPAPRALTGRIAARARRAVGSPSVHGVPLGAPKADTYRVGVPVPGTVNRAAENTPSQQMLLRSASVGLT